MIFCKHHVLVAPDAHTEAWLGRLKLPAGFAFPECPALAIRYLLTRRGWGGAISTSETSSHHTVPRGALAR